MTIQNNSEELLAYLVNLHDSGSKNWFGYKQQRIAGIYLAYEIAKRHAPNMSPEECADYASRLGNAVYEKLVKAGNGN